jgi:hypothetical protein
MRGSDKLALRGTRLTLALTLRFLLLPPSLYFTQGHVRRQGGGIGRTMSLDRRPTISLLVTHSTEPLPPIQVRGTPDPRNFAHYLTPSMQTGWSGRLIAE